jgi:hypothetical protein
MCSRSRGGAGVGVIRRRHGFGGAGDGRYSDVGGTSRRWQRPFFDRIRVRMSVENWLRGRSRTSSPSPHLPFIALCDGGPPTKSGWAPPIRARDQGTKVVGSTRKEIKPNILPLDLSSFSLFFNFILKTFDSYFLTSILFHCRLVH